MGTKIGAKKCHANEFKAKVVLAALREDRTLCRSRRKAIEFEAAMRALGTG